MKRDISYAARQIIGHRTNQEDSLQVIDGLTTAPEQSGALLLICDGMGGHIAGEIASKLVISTMAETFDKAKGSIPQKLKFAAEQSNAALAAHIKSQPHLRGMGTTLIAVFICERLMYWYSVGDSPLWLIRENKVRRLNEDHSMSALFDTGSEQGIDATNSVYFSGRNYLMSAMNGSKPEMVDCPTLPFILRDEDQLILATDGIETLPLSRLSEIVTHTSESPISHSIDAIFDEIERMKNPHQDNASAILVRIGLAGDQENSRLFHTGERHTPTPQISTLTKSLLIILIIIVILAIFRLQQ